jgi:hypothetical protein
LPVIRTIPHRLIAIERIVADQGFPRTFGGASSIRCQQQGGQMATQNRNDLQTDGTHNVGLQKPAFIDALRFWLKWDL